MRLVEVRSAKPGEMPFSRKTAYKYRTLHKYPKLLIKVAGKLYFDVDEWKRMCERAVAEQVAQAKRIRG